MEIEYDIKSGLSSSKWISSNVNDIISSIDKRNKLENILKMYIYGEKKFKY